MQTISAKTQRTKAIQGSLSFERRAHGFTQDALGKAMAEGDRKPVANSTIVGWERGNGSITLERAWQLADMYGISLDQLAGRTPPVAVA